MNILGNDPENDDDDENMLVCAPVSSSPRPVYGSVRADCGECKSPVWVSVSGQKAMRERKNLRPFCMKCAFRKIGESDEKPTAEIVPGAIEELRRHFLKINEN